jgi:hypothetical protein
MTRKSVWVLTGLIYVALVIGGYSLITGANPLENHRLHENHEPDSGHVEEEGHANHGSSMEEKERNEEEVDHHDQHSGHGGDTQVHVGVTYSKGTLTVTVKDMEGASPELLETHEKPMHLIVVSGDLEEYYHFHPSEREAGVFEEKASLDDGQYYAFVDIHPKDEKYITQPIDLQVGAVSHGHRTKPSLQPETKWTRAVNGKEVELRASDLIAGQPVSLTFDLKGDMPQPYLGALGHVVIIDEEAEEFIHVHPTSKDKTVFEAYFEQPGIYKLWAEFKFKDKGVLVFPFVIAVQ